MTGFSRVGVHVDDRGERDVDAHVAQAAAHGGCYAPGCVDVVECAEGSVARVRRAGRRLQTGDVAALLVGHHQHRAEAVQLGGELGGLVVVLHVLGEPADPAEPGVDPSREPVGDGRADEAGHHGRVREAPRCCLVIPSPLLRPSLRGYRQAGSRKRDHRSRSRGDSCHAPRDPSMAAGDSPSLVGEDVHDDPVSVAAVDRPDELGDPPVGHPRGALEEERRRTRLDAQQVGLLGRRQVRFDGLGAGRRSACRSARRAARRTRCPRGPGRSARAPRRTGRAGPPAPSARRRRCATRRTCRTLACGGTPSRPARIMPAGETRAKTVCPPGRRPRARMSAENDVAVSRWVTFGGATNVPEPWRRISRCSATSWSTARRKVIRATPRSRARSRSTGNGSPGDSVAISSSRLAPDLPLLGRVAADLNGRHGPLVQHARTPREPTPGCWARSPGTRGRAR